MKGSYEPKRHHSPQFENGYLKTKKDRSPEEADGKNSQAHVLNQ